MNFNWRKPNKYRVFVWQGSLLLQYMIIWLTAALKYEFEQPWILSNTESDLGFNYTTCIFLVQISLTSTLYAILLTKFNILRQVLNTIDSINQIRSFTL